jgi:energy-coupling factor transport system substrate-specific component
MERMGRKLELKDIIMIGVIGVLFAAIYLATTALWTILQAALTPFGAATFAVDIIYGTWFMAGSLSAFILRKPGAAFIAEFLASIIEMLMGNFGGPMVVLFGAIQGAGNEVGFALTGYRNFRLLGMILSGVMAAVFSFVGEIFAGTVELLSTEIVVAKLALRVASAVVFTGVISWLAGKGLAHTGVLKSYPAGADVPRARILED